MVKTFDVSKNGIISEQIVPVDKGSIVVGVYSWNGGEQKLGETRIIDKTDGSKQHAKIGRKTLKEVEVTMPVILKMIALMQEAKK